MEKAPGRKWGRKDWMVPVLEELLGVSDRIIVMSEGRIAGELVTSSATQEKIMELASKFSEN